MAESGNVVRASDRILCCAKGSRVLSCAYGRKKVSVQMAARRAVFFIVIGLGMINDRVDRAIDHFANLCSGAPPVPVIELIFIFRLF